MARTQQSAKRSVGGRAPRRPSNSIGRSQVRSTLRKPAVVPPQDLPPAPAWDQGDLTPLREDSPEPSPDESKLEANFVSVLFLFYPPPYMLTIQHSGATRAIIPIPQIPAVIHAIAPSARAVYRESGCSY
jgi:hypothetical protein